MTLIVAVATGNFAVHASDRYVSVQKTPRNPSGDWDVNANKTVVVIGSDCWVVLGYTGLAYLDGKPTDQVIAEAISGYDDLSGGAAFMPWFEERYPHYREIRDRVERRIADAYTRLPTGVAMKYATRVLASGVQRKDGMSRGVMFRITVQGSGSKAEELASSLLHNQFHIDAVGMVNQQVIDRAKHRIETKQAVTAEDIRDIAMDAVIETSGMTDYVGDDAMGVILSNGEQTVGTHFRRSNVQNQEELFRRMKEHEDTFMYSGVTVTPYVLTHGMIYGPSAGTPGGWVSDSGLKFNFTGFDDPAKVEGKPVKILFAGQPRKPKP
ncbi:hypothetical protein [Mycobacterium paragordonae]|uniref:Uncharacterized protein n=1 Tax=Mycobacterium paragordonae TaxID=1389713 RepID=A0A4V3AXW1_9MYCO|nr:MULTISPECIES: hypothetical protein [Mycobacterium]MDP7733983.1 hypothetical protein [Mycobacterium paragordonae]OBJ89701.1 hypothetical protein A9W97_13890 [Mycobacterium gordonae]OBK60282.1 hypothetical protein A5656_12885 [Mycobacterium gordonae]TDL00795.1 hypothetical protein EUA02_05695 [Mycobacterium paragordonae]TDL09274.1 hypothetical protein EUA05_06695 [Mycobacterium paragordonae]